MAESLRLFFALWPDERVRAALSRAVPAVGPGGRAIAPANLHATLAFLGNVASERLPELIALAENVPAEPFTVTFDRCELWNGSLVALVPSYMPAVLLRLANALREALASAQFPTEARPYRAHVTVIRERRRGSARLEGLWASDEPPHIPAVEWPVREFVLVQSRVGAEGSQYDVMRRWRMAPSEIE